MVSPSFFNSNDQHIRNQLDFTSEVVNTASKEGADLDLLFEVTGAAIQSVQRANSLWKTIISIFFRLVGRVPEYEKLQNQAAQLQNQLWNLLDNESSEDIVAKINDTKKEIKEMVSEINHEIKTILIQMDEVDSFVQGLNTLSIRDNLDSQALVSCMSQASDPAHTLKQLETLKKNISKHYQDDPSNDLSLIRTLSDRLEAANGQLTVVHKRLTDRLICGNSYEIEQSASPYIKTKQKMPGGIFNGGNTCYLASGLQTIRAIAPYQKAIDPTQNRLKRREGESKSDLKKRQLIQKRGHDIIQKIVNGESVERSQINQFRKACYDYSFQGKRVVESKSNYADAAEVLSRILEALDFDGGSFQVKLHRTPKNNSSKTPVDANPNDPNQPIDPSNYSSLEELTLGKSEIFSTVEVSAYQYLGGYVSLQVLIDETWGDEELSNVRFSSHDSKGAPCVEVYDSMLLKKTIPQQKFPEVIRVTVKQLEDQKAILTQTDTVYPFGSGNGPKYRLRSIIEHRPGHYVAHTRQADSKFVEANDGWVSPSREELSGFAYYYIKES